MKKILFADKELYYGTSDLRKKSEGLICKLENTNYNLKVLDKKGIQEFLVFFGFSSPVYITDYEKKFKEILEILGHYDFLISHLGVNSQNYFEEFLSKLPKLSIAIVSDVQSHSEVKKRIGVFSYESPEIFEFLNR